MSVRLLHIACALGVVMAGSACSGSADGNAPALPPTEPVSALGRGGPCGAWGPLEIVGRTGEGNVQVDEVSGLGESHDFPGVIWTILDNGNVPGLVALDESGHALGTFVLPVTDLYGHSVKNVDWEDLSIQPLGGASEPDAIWIADTGTFPVERQLLDLYRIREPSDPAAASQDVSGLAEFEVVRFPIVFPPGREVPNADAMFVDPLSGDIFIVSKTLVPGTDLVDVWRITQEGLSTDPLHPGELRRVARITGRLDSKYEYGVTGAAISFEGDWIALKHREQVFMWPRRGSVEQTLRSSPAAPCTSFRPGSAPDADVGESIAFDYGPGGGIAGVWSTLDSPEEPNPPLHRSGCGPCPTTSLS